MPAAIESLHLKPGRALLALMLVIVLLSVLLPNTGIAWMRDHWAWFNWPMLLIERTNSVVNLVHAILFLMLGMAVRLAFPRWRAGRVTWAILLLGISTEVLQIWAPGRHPRYMDVIVDVVTGVLGWAAMRWMRR